ncbi:MAG TPA: SusD/RagB family nutrient-binding outer membrane lipoprotein [Gemmatimonadaceae bacterium]
MRVGSAVALALTAFGCSNDKITALNKNPNSPEDVPPGPLFTEASRLATARWFGGIDLRTYEWIVQQLAEVQYNDEDRYVRVHAADTEGSFNGAYAGELKDLTQIISKGQATNDPGIYAPAVALRTLVFSYITDSWGDVPYSQALKGDSVGSSLTPSYDKQQDIYTSFFAVLDKASKDLATASNKLGAADPIYGGDPAQWQKFVNTLRLRLAIRVVNADPALASAQIAAARAAPGGLILTNADNAYFPWPGDGVYNNPWADNLGARDDWRMSDRMVNIMNALNDPRLPIYAQTTQDDPTIYRGSPNGVLPTPPDMPVRSSTSRPGIIFYKGATTYGPTFGGAGASLPTAILTAAEANFTLAEAAERGMGGLTPAQAAGYYNAGISASLNQWNDLAASSGQSISASAMAAYLANPNVVYTGGTPGLKQIATQKYLALYTDGATSWFEWRRTCVPNTIVPGPDATLTYVPRRLEYPTTEATANSASLKAAIALQGTDDLGTRVWWDKAGAPTCS